jgi:hypothetical protein
MLCRALMGWDQRVLLRVCPSLSGTLITGLPACSAGGMSCRFGILVIFDVDADGPQLASRAGQLTQIVTRIGADRGSWV